jgi:hypothetical protein
MAFTTFVRVEDQFAQYDHPKGVELPPGASVVEDYPEHVGLIARPSKAFVDTAGNPTSRDAKNYDRQNKPAVQAEVAKRIEAGREFAVDPAKDNKADLVAALVADDAAQVAAQTSGTSAAQDTTITSDGDVAGSEI